MDFPSLQQPSPYHFPFPCPFSFPSHYAIPENYVHWRQTPESHIYSADLPGVRKEEIKVEVEDSRYLIIRTQETWNNESGQPPKSFMRKFRLPNNINIDGISANYENGVLAVTVPRNFTRREFFIDPADIPERLDVLARAA